MNFYLYIEIKKRAIYPDRNLNKRKKTWELSTTN